MTQGGNKVTASAQQYLPIGEIKEGTVVMKDHSLKAVIIVSALNFALKSEQEKESIIYSYQSFLNSLSFPIQIVANSRKLDLSVYLKSIRDAGSAQTNPLLKMQTEEYHSFVKELLETSNIMEKRFFVVVPYYPSGIEAANSSLLKKKHAAPVSGNFEEHKKSLLSRVEEIMSGLSGIGLRCAILGTEDLLQLYYSLYNPEVSQNEKVNSELQDINTDIVETEGAQNG